MANLVLYFTGTGNSLAIARIVADRLGNCRLQSIVGFPRGLVLPDCERIGFVFPVYAWGIPSILDDFLENVSFTGNPYFFAIATCDCSPGLANRFVDDRLRQQGKHLSAGFVLPMVSNFTPLGGAPAAEKVDRLLFAAEKRLDTIMPLFLRMDEGGCETSCSIVNTLSHIVYPLFRRFVNRSDQKFWATRDCSCCGLCAQICPVGNIAADDSHKPIWQGRCEQCMACLQFCPTQAIQSGWLTRGRRRYRHPRVTSEDIMAQQRSWLDWPGPESPPPTNTKDT